VDAYECICSRRSVRQYVSDRCPTDEDIRRVIHAASRAPSGGNGQPWHFYVVRDRGLIDRMRAAIRDALPDCEPAIRYGSFYNAPCVVAVCVDVTPRPYHASDPRIVRGIDDVYGNPDYFSVAAAVQNLLLAAHAGGLGACWCRPAPQYREALERLLGAPPHHKLVAGVSLGFCDHPPAPTPRRPVEEICTIIG